MKFSNEVGFTIIETMLFLAITALLVVGLLVGTGNSINTQRYRDSISSLQSFLQQQYSEVANVENDNTTNLCYGDSTTNNLRGQSNCVLLGRLITTTNNSNVLQIRRVVGYIPSSPTSSLDDIQIFKAGGYNISVTDTMNETYNLEWGSSTVDIVANGSNPMTFSILIVRSPNSGIVRTFINPNKSIDAIDIQNTSVNDGILNAAALQTPLKVCVDSNGLFTGARSAVIIDANSSGSSGIETLGDKSGC
jgi:type II secretory pathway pseudopilin PulG